MRPGHWKRRYFLYARLGHSPRARAALLWALADGPTFVSIEGVDSHHCALTEED